MGLIHQKDMQMILLHLDMVLVMHGLTMHASGHNNESKEESLRFFVHLQACLLEEPPYCCTPPVLGTFHTNDLEVCNWHLCKVCKEGQGENVDSQVLLNSKGDYMCNWWQALCM